MKRSILYIVMIAALLGVSGVTQAENSRSGGQSFAARLADAFLPGVPRGKDGVPVMGFAWSTPTQGRSPAFQRLYGDHDLKTSREPSTQLAPERAAPNLFYLRF
jgi:hypothetical protein